MAAEPAESHAERQRGNERQGTAQHRTIDVGRGDNISTARTGCARHSLRESPEDKNYAAILRLEQMLEELRANPRRRASRKQFGR